MDDNQYSTLSIATEDLKKRGFTEEFNIESNDCICTPDGLKCSPEEVEIVEFHRFEGVSNPADTSIIYALKANPEGLEEKKGILIDAYGADSSQKTAAFMRKLEEYH